jgi:hypothetical protein
MALTLPVNIESYGDNDFIAWIDNDKFKGTVVQADTEAQAFKKILTAVKVKIAYDYNIQIDKIEEMTITEEDVQKLKDLHTDGKKNINLIVA